MFTIVCSTLKKFWLNIVLLFNNIWVFLALSVTNFCAVFFHRLGHPLFLKLLFKKVVFFLSLSLTVFLRMIFSQIPAGCPRYFDELKKDA